jgi:hypothetical protein
MVSIETVRLDLEAIEMIEMIERKQTKPQLYRIFRKGNESIY